MSRRVTLLFAVAVAAGCASLAGALALASLDGPSAATLDLKPGVPTEASAAELRSLGDERREEFYWAGALPARRLELTDTERGIFVRYLTQEAAVGDKRSLYLTVATYELPRAFAIAREVAKRRGAIDRALPGGAIAVWQAATPTSIYLARAGSDRLVEVFDPDPRRARDLILSGRIRPVAGE
jgi:fermentation-respiration switch protein FrsA (DUF1100 family)